MEWPRIFLTTGEGTQPDMGNAIRSERDYVGKEQGDVHGGMGNLLG